MVNVSRVVALLTQLRRLLFKHGVKGFLSDIEDLLKASSLPPEAFNEKIYECLFHYGGMGSPSDLYISKQNGNQVEREKEANYEVQALFNALDWEVEKPKKFPSWPPKHFDRYPSTFAEWEGVLTSGDIETIFDVLIFITYHHPDWPWVQDWCLDFTYHSNLDVRALAARCLADLARLHKCLDAGKVLMRLAELMSDPESDVSEAAEQAVQDIDSVLNVLS